MTDRNKVLASSVAAVLGLGDVTCGPTICTFYAKDTLLRVASPYDDPEGTKEVLDVAHGAGLACVPMRNLSAPTINQERVEVYPCLSLLARRPSMTEVGSAMASLHAIEVPPTIRRARRIDQLRTRLADSLVPDSVSAVLMELLDNCDRLIEQDQGPWGLIHMDAHRDNLLATPKGSVWIDFEYAGWGPQTLDLAITMRMAYRFYDDVPAQRFLAGYATCGQRINIPALVRLLPVYDVIGTVDVALQWGRPGADVETLTRLASLSDPFSTDKWNLFFEASP